MLNATMEKRPMRGSRAMLRRMATSAFMSSGCKVAEREFCGAKLTSTFTFSGPSPCWVSGGRSGLRGDPENRGQQVFRSRQLAQRDTDLIARVELHVEAQQRLDLVYRARQILAGILGFENGGIGVKNAYQAAGSGALHHGLP